MSQSRKVAAWALMQGDTLLGTLMVHDADWPWVYCHFEGLPPFEAIRPLFAEELRIYRTAPDSDEAREESEQAYEAIARLGLTLVAEDGDVVQDFLLHIDGDKAWFRY